VGASALSCIEGNDLDEGPLRKAITAASDTGLMRLWPSTGYRPAYALAFPQAGPRARQAVTETFDILWLTWDDATSSPDKDQGGHAIRPNQG